MTQFLDCDIFCECRKKNNMNIIICVLSAPPCDFTVLLQLEKVKRLNIFLKDFAVTLSLSLPLSLSLSLFQSSLRHYMTAIFLNQISINKIINIMDKGRHLQLPLRFSPEILPFIGRVSKITLILVILLFMV